VWSIPWEVIYVPITYNAACIRNVSVTVGCLHVWGFIGLISCPISTLVAQQSFSSHHCMNFTTKRDNSITWDDSNYVPTSTFCSAGKGQGQSEASWCSVVASTTSLAHCHPPSFFRRTQWHAWFVWVFLDRNPINRVGPKRLPQSKNSLQCFLVKTVNVCGLACILGITSSNRQISLTWLPRNVVPDWTGSPKCNSDQLGEVRHQT